MTATATDVPATTEAVAPCPTGELELSVVIPCLNEHETIGIVVEKATRAIKEAGIVGEVIVADNGSNDGSQEIARQRGARVVDVPSKGYGNALQGGIEASNGRFVIMGDADDSYDFLEIPKFVAALREGAELAQGCRLPWGGGTVKPGAMPFLHYWWGNPMFSVMGRWMFNAPIHDVYCGLRGFTRDLYDRLDMQRGGMEFAIEMIIKSSVFGARITEVPTTLHPDGRKLGRPHLRTFRDGWRTLRTFLQFSPRWTFAYPGALLLLVGLVGYGLALPGVQIGPAILDVHTLLVSSVAILMGAQLLAFAIFARGFAVANGLLPRRPWLDSLARVFPIERVMTLAAGAVACGLGLIGYVAYLWQQSGFGALDYPWTMRLVVPGATLVALGAGVIMSALFVSLLALRSIPKP